MRSNSFNKVIDENKHCLAFSFQGPQVTEILLSGKKYNPESEKGRESGIYGKSWYEKEIEYLNGEFPIWCFSNKNKDYTLRDFLIKPLLGKFVRELSLKSEKVEDLHLIQLSVAEDRLISPSHTHSGTHIKGNNVKVFSNLDLKDVCAIYKVTIPQDRLNPDGNMYPIVTLINGIKGNPFFGEYMDLQEMKDGACVEF